MQTKSTDSFKQRRLLGWRSCLALFLGVPLLTLLLYSGYCWGLWGRSSLLLQHYFQCKCPSASEKARYPKDAEILFSACRYTYSELSPSGRFLLVSEDKSGQLTYLLNLQTMEKTPTPSFSSFLTDELVFVENGLEDIILEFFTGKKYPIRTFGSWQLNAYVDGKLNLEMLVDTLQTADEIYLTENYGTVIVLMPEFPADRKQSFTFDNSDIPGSITEKVKQFLMLHNIEYEALPKSYPREVVSPDGKFVARDDGVYLAQINQRIIESDNRLLVRGWTNDGRSAIYTSHFVEPCLLRLALPLGDDS